MDDNQMENMLNPIHDQASDATMNKIASDDPACVELEVGSRGRYSPPDGNWGGLGEAIGKNFCLEKLSLASYRRNLSTDHIQAFFRGVAKNRSLKELYIEDKLYNPDDADVFAILITFFQNNKNFERLKIIDSPGYLHSLAATLGKFDSLQELSLFGCKISDEALFELTQKLLKHSNLRKLDLSGNYEIGRLGYYGLKTLLQNPESRLTALSLRGNCIRDEVAAATLAGGLAGNSSLEELELSENDFTGRGWGAIFMAFQNPNCKLESLDIHPSRIDDAAARFLSNALTNGITLKALNLVGSCGKITSAGWQELFESLRSSNSIKELNLAGNRRVTANEWQIICSILSSPNSALEKLDVSNNGINDGINDEVARLLMHALANNNRLKELILRGNHAVTPTGWVAFSSVLQNPNSALEKLDLRWNNGINDGAVHSFANSLTDNSSLKELLLAGIHGITANGWAAFLPILCNDSSIAATYGSNHTLQEIMYACLEASSGVPEDVSSLLRLNHENSSSQAVRLKIIKTHFREGFVTQPFLGMEQNIMPHALAWMGTAYGADETNGHRLYDFLRRTTTWSSENSESS